MLTADQAVRYARETVPAAEELERQLGPGPE
ncbi:hypothetical protein GGQ91_005452 [Methylobacterium fujisawaense]|uniref:Uncharacterized protein n=1 Tax=Methylobacterium fujisawaense TaxID=107400 RepID=A0ABR6DIW2_9HYPH|nr:hypothetical protein [Methylobacterium fujisawaense]